MSVFRIRKSPHKKDDATFVECPCGNLLVAVSVADGKVSFEDRGADQSVSFPADAWSDVKAAIDSAIASLQ